MGLNELKSCKWDTKNYTFLYFYQFQTSKHAIKLEETFFMINNKIAVYSIFYDTLH